MGDELRINDTLEGRDMYVRELRSAMHYGTSFLGNIPELVKRIIREDVWRERVVLQTHEQARFQRFADFVIEPEPKGLGTDLDTIKRLCRDDVEAVDLIDEATKGKQGERTDLVNNVHNVRTERPSGNSQDRAMRQLCDKADEDERVKTLYEAVLAGELSPHAAAVAAGFRKRTFNVPAEPQAALRALVKRFGADVVWEAVDKVRGQP